VPAAPGLGAPDGVLDGLADDDEVVAVRAEVLGLAVPPVDASATPATPPPSPAAMTAVRMSRLIRPEVLGTIRASPSVLGPRPDGTRRRSSKWPALLAD
jgi:hypothetical protein